MNATTTKLNIVNLKKLTTKESKVYFELLGLNKSVNERDTDIYYTIGQFVSKSITLNNGDFSKETTANKILCILYSYFKSNNKKYPLRLIAKQNKKDEWIIASCTEEKAIEFYLSLETKENLERIEKIATAKAKAKAKSDDTRKAINAIADSKNVTVKEATELYKKEVETSERAKALKGYSDAELLMELLDRGILDNSDIDLLKKRIAENAEIA